MTIAICGSRYIEVRMPVEQCETCGRRRRMLRTTEEWYGTYWTCLTCGDTWHSDEGRMERPFMRGWREHSVERAKAFWRRHGVKRFSKREMAAWLDTYAQI